MRRHSFWKVCILTALAFVAGCGGGNSNANADKEVPTEQLKIRRFSAEELPIGDYLPRTLDGGRLKLAEPKGWITRLPDGIKLAQFGRDEKMPYSYIIVTSEVPPSDEFSTVTEETVQQFAKSLEDELKAANRVPFERVRPMMLGDVACARYVTLGRMGSVKLERQFVVTQAAGRRYIVELRVRPDEILEDRDYAYAVVASMQFLKSSSGGETPTEIKPDQDSSE